LMWSKKGMANVPEPLLQWRSNPVGVSHQFAPQQAKNYRTLVRTNLERLNSIKSDGHLADLIWRLQVCAGLDEPIEQVQKALITLEELLKSFNSYFEFSGRDGERFRKIAHRRCARTLLHNALQYSYSGRAKIANEFARLATDLDKTV